MSRHKKKPAHGGDRGAGLLKRSNRSKHNTSNSSDDQRKRLLQALESTATSTIEARRDLDILMPASRVHELRHRYGYNIGTVWINQATDSGKVHRVALYQLHSNESLDEVA